MRSLISPSDVLTILRDIGQAPWRLTLWDGVEHFLGEMEPNGHIADIAFIAHLRRVFCTHGHLVARMPSPQPSRLDAKGRVIVTPDKVEIFLFRPPTRLSQREVARELGRFPEHDIPWRGAFRSEQRYAVPLPTQVEAMA